MVAKIADDMEAIRAGLARLEEENRRRISGDTSPQPVPVEEYQEEIPGIPPNHWGLIGGMRLPTVKIAHPIGSWRFEVDKQCYEYWVGDRWVDEDWGIKFVAPAHRLRHAGVDLAAYLPLILPLWGR